MHKWSDGSETDTQQVALARTDIGVTFRREFNHSNMLALLEMNVRDRIVA